jgi:hypothetical protein
MSSCMVVISSTLSLVQEWCHRTATPRIARPWRRWAASSVRTLKRVTDGLLHLADALLGEALGLLRDAAGGLAGLLLDLAYRFLHAALHLVAIHGVSPADGFGIRTTRMPMKVFLTAL